ETLPFDDAVFDYTLIVTTICFVDDVCAVLAETHRVLKPAGCVVIGFIDRASALAQRYLMLRDTNV
ncbi:MAG: methyltransferase domain-containing protein, partial [Burkholderiales bacterium]|nr:methyltransferase domain-containing protein [Burkholderiales bacterium]